MIRRSDSPVVAPADAGDGPGEPPRAVAPREAVQRWRLVVHRTAVPPEQAQRAQLAAWESALEACGLPVAGLDAVPPRPRFAVAAPLAAAVPGERELLDVFLAERVPAWRAREAIAACQPDGYRLIDLYDVWLGEPPLPGQVVASVYVATVDATGVDAVALRAAAASALSSDALPRSRRKGESTVAYDLRPLVDAVEVVDRVPSSAPVPPEGQPEPLRLRMTLRHDAERGVGRPEELLAELGERLGATLEPQSLVRESLVLASDRPAPGGGRTTGRPGPAGARPGPRGARRSGPGGDRPRGS